MSLGGFAFHAPALLTVFRGQLFRPERFLLELFGADEEGISACARACLERSQVWKLCVPAPRQTLLSRPRSWRSDASASLHGTAADEVLPRSARTKNEQRAHSREMADFDALAARLEAALVKLRAWEGSASSLTPSPGDNVRSRFLRRAAQLREIVEGLERRRGSGGANGGASLATNEDVAARQATRILLETLWQNRWPRP